LPPVRLLLLLLQSLSVLRPAARSFLRVAVLHVLVLSLTELLLLLLPLQPRVKPGAPQVRRQLLLLHLWLLRGPPKRRRRRRQCQRVAHRCQHPCGDGWGKFKPR
jgi:hypothetical protein